MSDDAATIAKRRFQVISTIRLGAAAMAVLGFLLWRTDALGVTAPALGRATLAIGLALLVALPVWLARRWRR